MALAQIVRSGISSNEQHKYRHICCQSFTAVISHTCGSVGVYQVGLTGALPICQVLIDGRQLVHVKVVDMYAKIGQQAKLPGIQARIAMFTMHEICSASSSISALHS